MTRYRTPYADDALHVGHGTTAKDISKFVIRRSLNPEYVGDLTVWNYNNHELNHNMLRKQSSDFIYDEYIVPYQVSGIWGYMFTIIPDRIRKCEILTYTQKGGEYLPFPNYLRHSTESEDTETIQRIDSELNI